MQFNSAILLLFIITNIKISKIPNVKADSATSNNGLFDGPKFHEVLHGGMLNLRCASSRTNKELLYKNFNSPAAHLFQIKWVHKKWDQLIDPWKGDGRRSYSQEKIIQSGDEIGLSNVHTISSILGASLKVFAANPSDTGIYACMLSKDPFSRGLSLNLTNALLISVHIVRIAERKSSSESNANAQEIKATFFDAWTWQIYQLKRLKPTDVLFEVDCYADILLTAMVLQGIDQSFVRIGWKFIPRGGITFGKDPEDGSLIPWDFLSPVDNCMSSKVECQEVENKEHEDKPNNLQTMYHLAIRKLWKARWLRLTANKPFTSGTWQCWFEGLNVQRDMPAKGKKWLTRWFISEVNLFYTEHSDFYWWNTVELWRVLATFTAPICYILFYLLVAIAWGSASRWSKYLYRPPTENQASEDNENDPYEFDAKNYAQTFLKNHGINEPTVPISTDIETEL